MLPTAKVLDFTFFTPTLNWQFISLSNQMQNLEAHLYGETHGLLFRWRRKDKFSTGVVLSAVSAIGLKRTNCRFKVFKVFKVFVFSFLFEFVFGPQEDPGSKCLSFSFLFDCIILFCKWRQLQRASFRFAVYCCFCHCYSFLSVWSVFAFIFYYCYIHSRVEGFFALVFLI